jgi:hypothetical protein
MSQIQITLHVKKCLFKYGDGQFTRFNWNTIIQIYKCYHSSLMGNFICFAYDSEYKNLIYDNASFEKSDFDNKKIHYTPTNSMLHNFLNVPKIMNCENIIYFVALSKKFHPSTLYKYKHSKKLIFFQHCFMSNFNKFLKVVHINK